MDGDFARDTIPAMKPHFKSYAFMHKIIKYMNVSVDSMFRGNEIIFFDDQPINLKTAKIFGWTTVLIGNAPKQGIIDYQFSNINDALNHFI